MRSLPFLLLMLVAGCAGKDHYYGRPAVHDTTVVQDTVSVPSHHHGRK